MLPSLLIPSKGSDGLAQSLHLVGALNGTGGVMGPGD